MTAGRQPPDPWLELVDRARQEDAARSRAEIRDRLERASETATWIGTLNDLWERCAAVTVTTGSGRTRRGRLHGVGHDHLALATDDGAIAYLMLSTVRLLRPGRPVRLGPVTGDRSRALSRTFPDVLERIREERIPAALWLAGMSERLRGEVLGLGEDVLTLHVAGVPGQVVYVSIAAVEEVLVPNVVDG